MSQLLLIVGAVLVLLGLGSIAAGAPDWLLGLSMGATLIQSGTVALVGGLILAALSVVLNALQELTGKLGSTLPAGQPAQAVPMLPDRAPTQRQPQASEGRPARPREAPPPPEPVHDDPYGHAAEPHTDAEPSRPRRERPREPQSEAPRLRRPAPAQPAPASAHEEQPPARAPHEAPGHFDEEPARPQRPPRSFDQTNENLARLRSEPAIPRREEQPRPRREPAPGPIPPLPQPFGKEERERRRPAAEAPPPSAPEPYTPKFRPADTPPPASASARPPAPAPSGPPASEQVVRSGVIGGMAYTLYADGSIEAELAIGTVRFDSISDLQDHVLRTGQEADADFEDQQR